MHIALVWIMGFVLGALVVDFFGKEKQSGELIPDGTVIKVRRIGDSGILVSIKRKDGRTVYREVFDDFKCGMALTLTNTLVPKGEEFRFKRD